MRYDFKGARSKARVMADSRDNEQSKIDRKNDAKLITPLLLVALVIVGIFLYYGYTGHLTAG